MGVEIVEANAPGWERGWSQGHAENQYANLFTNGTKSVEHVIRAKLAGDTELSVGDKVRVCRNGAEIKISDGQRILGNVVGVPAAVAEAVTASKSAVGEVRALRRSGSVEVVLK